jgi:hypothetical protein
MGVLPARFYFVVIGVGVKYGHRSNVSNFRFPKPFFFRGSISVVLGYLAANT